VGGPAPVSGRIALPRKPVVQTGLFGHRSVEMAAQHSRLQRFGADNAASEWTPVDRGHDVVARVHLRLRPGPQAAGEGRHALDRLEGAVDNAQLSELRLLVTELLTNSVRHGGGEAWITLEVDIYANAVRVVVTDHGPGFEQPNKPTPHLDRTGGWGLCLVDRLADRWGVDRGDQTAVWFEVDRGGFARAA
jgi:anti-sigma regulatory factor (Ser/Thr protein kinase)